MTYSMLESIGKYGIINRMVKPYSTYAPAIQRFSTMLYPVTTKIDIIGGGVGLTSEDAQIRAIGEGLERYSNMVYDMRRMVYSTYNSLRERNETCVSPDLFTLYSKEQYNSVGFAYEKPTEDTPLWWTKVNNLNSNEDILYPAEFFFLSFPNKLHTPLSTGAALHNSLEQAKVNSILEVVERDAIMLTWKRKIRVPQIDTGKIKNVEIKFYLQRFEREGYKVDLFDMTMEHGIPSILATARGGYGLPALSVAAATEISLSAAILKSLNELVLSSVWSVNAMQTKMREPGKQWGSLEAHSAYYLDPECLEALDFLYGGSLYAVDELENSKKQFNNKAPMSIQIIEVLKEFGFEVYGLDITPRDVAQLGCYAYKSVIPKMLPLDVEDPFDGLSRLYNIPKVQWEYSPKINRFPQPFA